MNKLTTCLWFDNQAEEAVDFYTSIFKNSKKGGVSHYSDAGPGVPGSVMVATFELNGQQFMALNGGPMVKFNWAVSMVVNCDTQEEIDYYWERLQEGGGAPEQCGWLRDRFGLSWQIVPSKLEEWLTGDQQKAGNVHKAVMQMVKLDIAEMQRAYDEG